MEDNSFYLITFTSVSVDTYESACSILKYDLVIAVTHQNEVLEYGLNHPTSSEMNVTVSLHL
jgi:hypothetical protein